MNFCVKHKSHFGFSISDNGLSSILQNVLVMWLNWVLYCICLCVFIYIMCRQSLLKMKCSSEIFVRNTKPILEFYISHNGLSSILWNVIDLSCMYIWYVQLESVKNNFHFEFCDKNKNHFGFSILVMGCPQICRMC